MFRKRARHILARVAAPALLIALTFWVSPGQAQSSAATVANAPKPSGGETKLIRYPPSPWNTYFAGRPGFIVADRPLSTLLKANIQACRVWTTKMDTLVREYDRAAYRGRPAEANEIYIAIHDILFVKLGERDSCFKATAQAYALNSLFWLDNSAQLFTEPIDSRVAQVAQSMLFAAMINKKKVRLLTPANREKLGPAWTNRTESQKFEILGAYDCQVSEIAVDLFLRPLDLGATAIHEIDHFMRDKTLYLTGQQRSEQNTRERDLFYKEYVKVDKVNWPSLILFDETIAVAYSSVMQLRYRRSEEFQELNDDLSFSTADGPIARMWKTLDYTKSFFNYRRPEDKAGEFLYEYFMVRDYSEENKRTTQHSTRFGMRPHWQATPGSEFRAKDFYALVFGSYFVNKKPFDFLDELNPYRLSRMLSPLIDWGGWFNAVQETAIFNHDNFDGVKRFDDELRVLDNAMSGLRGTSLLCVSFKEALNSHTLDGYIGNKFADEENRAKNHSENGVKGENDDTKPEKGVKGESGRVKPENGVKGESSVTKPENGVKGELSAVRPCLNLGPKL